MNRCGRLFNLAVSMYVYDIIKQHCSLIDGQCTTKEEIAQLTQDVEDIKTSTRMWQNSTIHIFREYNKQQIELRRIYAPLEAVPQGMCINIPSIHTNLLWKYMARTISI